MGETTIFEVFPVNGLDRSLHAPVFAGLLFITLFAETLGWTFAGLVVPGYFVSVILAAPATAVLVSVETVITYFVCALLGRWLPRTGAWSTAFGRERFFLFILVALAVRLAVEANLLPWLSAHVDLPHSRELHSLGLVLVPLLANMFWNDGFVRSSFHVAVLVLLTYLVVDGVLLEYTNFTVSRFEVANESVSLSFLETPHAQFILLIGALIAARANVLYGWDYNGILVPALLSVAWYQPTKLVTTIVEALLVYGVARGLSSLPPLSKVLLVGTRRTLLVFTVGFAIKWVGGFALHRIEPTLQVIDFLGFGYLLPTLLATKMWNRNAIGTVIVPTVQVSLVAFAAGNLAGYAVTLLEPEEPAAEVAMAPVASARATAAELMLADTSPSVDVTDTAVRPRARLVIEGIDQLVGGRTVGQKVLRRAMQLNVRFSTTHGVSGSHLVIGPHSSDPDQDRATPRVAVRLSPLRAAPWLVIAESRDVGGAAIAAAELAAQLVDARALVVEATGRPQAAADRSFAAELVQVLHIEHVLRVSIGAHSELGVVGAVPDGTDARTFAGAFSDQLPLVWHGERTADAAPLRRAMSLVLTRADAERAAAGVLGAPGRERWRRGVGGDLSRHLVGLTSTRPFMFEAPSIEALRLFKRVVIPAFEALGAEDYPSPFHRAVAAQLGYRYVEIRQAVDQQPDLAASDVSVMADELVAWGLLEPASPRRQGHSTWIRRVGARAPAGSTVLVEAPASRWETGTYRAALVLFDGLPAQGLLLAGAPPNADAQGRADVRRLSGRRSYYHVIHEAWVDRGGKAVVTHGIAEARDPGRELVVSTGRELSGPADLPPWARDITGFFGSAGLDVAVFDGSLSLAPFDGGYDPALGYASRFAPDSTVLLWLGPGLRRHLVRIQEDQHTERRLERLAVDVSSARVADRAARRSRCDPTGANGGCPTAPPGSDCPADNSLCRCDPIAVVTAFETYTRRRSPHTLRGALQSGAGCATEVLRDAQNGLLWALVGLGEDTWLVPILGGPTRHQQQTIEDMQGLRRLVAAGLASGRVVL